MFTLKVPSFKVARLEALLELSIMTGTSSYNVDTVPTFATTSKLFDLPIGNAADLAIPGFFTTVSENERHFNTDEVQAREMIAKLDLQSLLNTPRPDVKKFYGSGKLDEIQHTLKGKAGGAECDKRVEEDEKPRFTIIEDRYGTKKAKRKISLASIDRLSNPILGYSSTLQALPDECRKKREQRELEVKQLGGKLKARRKRNVNVEVINPQNPRSGGNQEDTVKAERMVPVLSTKPTRKTRRRSLPRKEKSSGQSKPSRRNSAHEIGEDHETTASESILSALTNVELSSVRNQPSSSSTFLTDCVDNTMEITASRTLVPDRELTIGTFLTELDGSSENVGPKRNLNYEQRSSESDLKSNGIAKKPVQTRRRKSNKVAPETDALRKKTAKRRTVKRVVGGNSTASKLSSSGKRPERNPRVKVPANRRIQEIVDIRIAERKARVPSRSDAAHCAKVKKRVVRSAWGEESRTKSTDRVILSSAATTEPSRRKIKKTTSGSKTTSASFTRKTRSTLFSKTISSSAKAPRTILPRIKVATAPEPDRPRKMLSGIKLKRSKTPKASIGPN